MISPCINVCKIAPDTQVCIGCFRTLQEIAEWSRLTDQQRFAIMHRLKVRTDEKAKEEKNGTHSL
jgi:predicted Fe-S protein YdhL (DUF1289 family)